MFSCKLAAMHAIYTIYINIVFYSKHTSRLWADLSMQNCLANQQQQVAVGGIPQTFRLVQRAGAAVGQR